MRPRPRIFFRLSPRAFLTYAPGVTRYAVARVEEVGLGQVKIVELAGTGVGLFKLPDGSWRAYENFCPHAGAPVCTGSVSAGMPPILRCPWHGWEFDLLTGRLAGRADCALDSFQVDVADGTVFVWA